MMNLTQNLQELLADQKQATNKPLEQPFTNGRFSSFSLYHPNINRDDLVDALSFGQIETSKFSSVESIRSSYRSVWKKIADYENQFLQQQENEQYRSYQKYLEIKKRYFLRFYAFDLDFSQQDIDNLRVFDSLNIIGLFQEIQAFVQIIHSKTKGTSGTNLAYIKIEGYLLLQQLCYFLREISIAIYPFNYQSESCLAESSESELLKTFEEYTKQDKDHHQALSIQLKPFVDHSIYQLGCEIQSIENNGKNNQNIDSLGKLKLLRFYHRIIKYYYKYISEPCPIDRNLLYDFLSCQPLFIIDDKLQIISYKNTKELKFLSFQRCFRFHRRILRSIKSISKDKSEMIRIMQKNGVILINMIELWIDLTESSAFDLKLYQNYILLLKIYQSYSKGYLLVNIDRIYGNLSRYVQGLIKYLFTSGNKITSRIVEYDQQLTYSLLTTSKLIDNLQIQQTKIIEKLGSMLQFIKQLFQLPLKQDKIEFITFIIKSDQYCQSQKLREKIEAPSKLTLTKIYQIIEDCIGFIFDQTEFYKIKQYLNDLKHTIILLKNIKNSTIHKTVSIDSQQKHIQLQQTARYFMKVRPNCIIYQLKSKILLFIVLFKLGYYSPIIKRDGQVIHLSNHIANIYNKLYTNTAAKLFNSKICLEIADKIQVFDEKHLGTIQKQCQFYEIQMVAHEQNKDVLLKADKNLSERLQKFMRNLSSNVRDSEVNCKTYLTDLITFLQNDLFLRQKQQYKQSEQILTRRYQEFIAKSMQLAKDQNAQKLSQIEGFFFNEQYQKSWKLLMKEKRENQYFNEFLNRLALTGGKRNSVLKLLRIYMGIAQMDHLFNNQLNQSYNVNELVSHINANSNFPIPQKAVQQIYRSQIEQTKILELQLFFQNHKQEKQVKIQENYEQYNSCLSVYGLKTLRNNKNNKATILVKLPAEFAKSFDEFKKQIQKYSLYNYPGISKVNFAEIINQQLCFQLQLNPLFVMIPSPNKSKIMLNIDDFKQNNFQKLARNFAVVLIQTYSLLKVGEQFTQKIQFQEIFIDQKDLSFNINPFFMLCLSMLVSLGAKIKIQQKITSNLQHLSNILQNIYNKLSRHFSPHFKNNFITLIQYLRTVKYELSIYSQMLQFPLFMSLHQKADFIVYFDNKMSQMCDKIYERERELRKNRKLKDIQQMRADAMKTQAFQNYTYNFMYSGIVERQMVDQSICGNSGSSKLDWITGHQKLKISYELPRDQYNDIKEYVYSINFLMKCLRGAIAHKMNLSYEIILSFNDEYPELIDFLFYRRHLLDITYSKMMQDKNNWIKNLFREGQKSATKLKNSIMSFKKDINSKMNIKINEAYNVLIDYSSLYEDEIRNTLNRANVKCDKCNQLIKIASLSNSLIDFLVNISKKVNENAKFLSVSHNYFGCFLLGSFKNHRQLKMFGQRVQLGDIKNHLIINWWFYLQTTFPSLVEMLTRVKYLVFDS